MAKAVPVALQKSGGGVYLLEFSKPIGSTKHSARYYIGWAKDSIYKRVQQHRKATERSAAITRAAVRDGAKLKVVRVWLGETRDFERKLKNRKNHKALVPKN
jgi:hypothetical protein